MCQSWALASMHVECKKHDERAMSGGERGRHKERKLWSGLHKALLFIAAWIHLVKWISDLLKVQWCLSLFPLSCIQWDCLLLLLPETTLSNGFEECAKMSVNISIVLLSMRLPTFIAAWIHIVKWIWGRCQNVCQYFHCFAFNEIV